MTGQRVPRTADAEEAERGGTHRGRCACCGCTRGNYHDLFFRKFPDGWPAGHHGYACARSNPFARPRDGCRGTMTDRRDVTVDHVVPQARDCLLLPPFAKVHCLRNLRPMCRSCNSAKGERFGLADLAFRLLPDAGRAALQRVAVWRERRRWWR